MPPRPIIAAFRPFQKQKPLQSISSSAGQCECQHTLLLSTFVYLTVFKCFPVDSAKQLSQLAAIIWVKCGLLAHLALVFCLKWLDDDHTVTSGYALARHRMMMTRGRKRCALQLAHRSMQWDASFMICVSWYRLGFMVHFSPAVVDFDRHRGPD